MSVEERERKGLPTNPPTKNLVSYFIYTISLPLISFDSPVTHSTTRICLIREERETDRWGNETGLENSLDQNKCFQLFDLL